MFACLLMLLKHSLRQTPILQLLVVALYLLVTLLGQILIPIHFALQQPAGQPAASTRSLSALNFAEANSNALPYSLTAPSTTSLSALNSAEANSNALHFALQILI